jgi:lysophospholipase L1-like esterase
MSTHEQTAEPAPAKRVLSRARRRLFIFLSLVVVAGLQELAFRWMFPLPECSEFNRIHYTRLHMFGSEIGRAHHRGLSNVKIRWECEPDGFAFDHTLNLYGFRGPEFQIEPPPDRDRIVFVGDSFVEGCGAADEDTIPQQFARLLEDERSVEALNLGVAAADFPEYTLLVRDGVHLLKPRALFLIVCANDLPVRRLTPQEEEDKVPSILLDPPAKCTRPNPYVPRVLEVMRRRFAGQAISRRFPTGPFPFMAPVPSDSNPLTSHKAPSNVDPQILQAMRKGTSNPWNAGIGEAYAKSLSYDFAQGRGVKRYLRHIQDLCRAEKTRLIVVYLPYYVATNPDYIAAQNRLGGTQYTTKTRFDRPPYRNQQLHLEQVTRELGIPFLDLTEEFIEAEKTLGRMFWPIDGHCTAAGYRLVAETCARYWTKGAMPRPAPAPAEPPSTGTRP